MYYFLVIYSKSSSKYSHTLFLYLRRPGLLAANTDEEKNHHFDDVCISFSSLNSSFFDSFALFVRILFWLAGYFSLSSLWLTSPFNSTSLFQSKQDFQRRKEEMALAVEATRKRLEAVST